MMHGMENKWKIMSFGVMEMPVQGSNPGAPRGVFLGQQLRATPPVERPNPSKEGYCLWIGQRLSSFPNLDSTLKIKSSLALKISAKVSVKRFLSKATCFPRVFQEISRGLLPPCPSKILRSAPRQPRGLGGFSHMSCATPMVRRIFES